MNTKICPQNRRKRRKKQNNNDSKEEEKKMPAWPKERKNNNTGQGEETQTENIITRRVLRCAFLIISINMGDPKKLVFLFLFT